MQHILLPVYAEYVLVRFVKLIAFAPYIHVHFLYHLLRYFHFFNDFPHNLLHLRLFFLWPVGAN